MTTVTISSKFQLVVPRSAREALQLKPGQKLEVLVYEDRLELVPVRDLKAARGFLKGIDTTVPRDKDRV
jgi:AbrB family looped-hinge helix DNA binding protein